MFCTDYYISNQEAAIDCRLITFFKINKANNLGEALYFSFFRMLTIREE